MAFWDTNTLDPKRQFKFKVTFSSLTQDAQFLAQSADRPVYVISDGTKVDFLDKSFHFPGKITWNPVKIKFVDALGTVNVSKTAYSYLAQAGWINPKSVTGGNPNFGTINKQSATNLNVMVEVLNSNGTSVDKWILKNAFITTVALNNLDYSSEAILTAEFNFRYDWAELE